MFFSTLYINKKKEEKTKNIANGRSVATV